MKMSVTSAFLPTLPEILKGFTLLKDQEIICKSTTEFQGDWKNFMVYCFSKPPFKNPNLSMQVKMNMLCCFLCGTKGCNLCSAFCCKSHPTLRWEGRERAPQSNSHLPFPWNRPFLSVIPQFIHLSCLPILTPQQGPHAADCLTSLSDVQQNACLYCILRAVHPVHW